jgi:hypothetical protein
MKQATQLVYLDQPCLTLVSTALEMLLNVSETCKVHYLLTYLAPSPSAQSCDKTPSPD